MTICTDTLIDPATVDNADFGRCTCHSIREGSGVSYSLAMIGSECDSCAARNSAYDQLHEWNEGMTASERRACLARGVAYRWDAAVANMGSRTAKYVDPWADCPF